MSLDLYQQSVVQVPKVIEMLKGKGFSFLTAAACNNDMNPHTVTNPALSPLNAEKNTTATPIASDAVNDTSATPSISVNKKSVSVSSSSVTMAQNASYIVSLAILIISVTILF